MPMTREKKIIDYRGDCWKAYQDVGLCLRILPPGESFEFILDRDKLEQIKKIVARNGGGDIKEKKQEGESLLVVEKENWS